MEEVENGIDRMSGLGQQIIDFFVEHGINVLVAVVVMIVGLWVVKRVGKVLDRVMIGRGFDPSLRPFLLSMLDILMKIVLAITVAGMVGIETTSFVAVLGAAGLAVGLALQGTLQNFAGGVLILIFKPYKVGDLIEAQGNLGNVKEIQIFVTIMLTPDNKTVIIPNGAISNGNITNYTMEGMIRVDLVIGISYDSDIKKARKLLMEAMESNPKVLKTPAPFVGVVELADSAINLAVRPYAKPEDYWDVYFSVYEAGKEALDAGSVTIPFPQVDVHMQGQ